MVLVTDGRYGDQAAAAAGRGRRRRARCWSALTGAAIIEHRSPRAAPRSPRSASRPRTSRYAAVRSAIRPRSAASSCRPTAWSRPSAGTRTPARSPAWQQACRIADAALAEVAPTARRRAHRGRGAQPARDPHARARRRAARATRRSWPPGPVNAALPAPPARPTPSIEDGHTVIIDVGALVDGYHSDMTRTFVVGEPTPQQQELYDVVLAAQRAGVAAVRAGHQHARSSTRSCRDIITEAGYGEWFTPRHRPRRRPADPRGPVRQPRPATLKLQVGDVVTVEPGVYREGFGGIRVEDLVVVTDDGCRVLTASPKDSPCLPSPPTT